MRSFFHNIQYHFLLYCTIIGIIIVSIFAKYVNHKSQILEEHINFLQLQVPLLQAENLYLKKEILKISNYKISSKERLKKFDPFLEFLCSNSNISYLQLKSINNYLVTELNTPDFIKDQPLNDLSGTSMKKLELYNVVSFQNKLINYIAQSVLGSMPCMMFKK